MYKYSSSLKKIMRKNGIKFREPDLERAYQKAAKRIKFKKSDLGIKNL